VKLVYSVSPAKSSGGLKYRITVRRHKRWVTVRRAALAGHAHGSHALTIKQLFASHPILAGHYRLELAAGKSSKSLGFRVE